MEQTVGVATPSFRKWVSIIAFLGFLAFMLYLYFFAGITEVASEIGRTDLFFYALAFVAVLGGVVFNSLTWYSLLGNFSIKAAFRRVFVLSWVGIFVDAIIPGGWSGDLFKAYLLAKDPKVDPGKTAASIVIKNILELSITLGALITGLILLVWNYSLEVWILISFGTTMILLALPLIIVISLSVNVRATKRFVGFLRRIFYSPKRGRGKEEGFDAKVEKALNEYHEGLRTMKTKPASLVRPLIFQILAWTFDVFTLFLIFASISYIVSPDKVLIVNTITGNLQVQGFAFAGFTQVVSSSLYSLLGIEPVISAASTLLGGFAIFWFKFVLSFLAFQCVVLSRCIPYICVRCGGWFGKKSCSEPEGTENEDKDPVAVQS